MLIIILNNQPNLSLMEQNMNRNDQGNNTNQKCLESSPCQEMLSQNTPKQTRRKKTSQKVIQKILLTKKATNYYWNNIENKRYVVFLKSNSHLFSLSQQERRIQKINLQMSKKVRTRNPTQCHTHHQKMMKKYGSIPDIIQNLQTSQDMPEDIPQVIPEMTPQQAPQEIKQISQQADKKIALKQAQICVYTYAPLVDKFIFGRFQNIEEESQHYWYNEQQLLSWMDLGQ